MALNQDLVSANGHALLESSPPPAAVLLCPTDRVMVIAPHPDDESLSAAGLLQRALQAGAAVRILYLTDGDRNPWAQLVVEGRWPLSRQDRARWGRRRRLEALAAIATLGVSPDSAVFVGLPDQGITRALFADSESLMTMLARHIDAWRPTLLAAPSLDDHHPDHNAAAVCVRLALPRLERPPRTVLHYRVHRRDDEDWGRSVVKLGAEERERKRESILCHASQLRWRRRQLLDFSTERELFLGVSAPPLSTPSHPVREAALDDRGLRARLDWTHGPRLGRARLHVLFDTAEQGIAAVSIRRPARSATRVARDAASGARVGQILIRATRPGVELRLALDAAVRQCFIKLDWAFERRLGFFDRWGWRSVRMRG